MYVNRFFTYSPSAPTHYHKISVYDKVLTQQDVEDIYNGFQPTPPLPPPPFVPTIPDIHWDFKTLYDNQTAAEFTNPYNIQIVDEKAVIDRAGPDYYLKANIPIELVSPFSKSLMFRFKSSTAFTNVVNFVFSTYEGDA